MPGKLILDINNEGKVTAADIKPSADFEITNPETYLATLNSSDASSTSSLMLRLGMVLNRLKRWIIYR